MAASILYDVIVFAPVEFGYRLFLGARAFPQSRDGGVKQRRGNVTYAEHGVKHLKAHKMWLITDYSSYNGHSIRRILQAFFNTTLEKRRIPLLAIVIYEQPLKGFWVVLNKKWLQ